MTREELMSVRVAEKIAAREGVPSSELTPPMYNVIDTDALDSLYSSTRDGQVKPNLEFTYNGYFVRIDSSGRIHIDETATTLDPDAHGLSC